MEPTRGFLLTRQWRDRPDGLELVFWLASDAGPLRIVVSGQQAVCFVERSRAPELSNHSCCTRKPLELADLQGNRVDGLYFRHQRDLQDVGRECHAKGVLLYESDIKPSDRFLMERFITGACEVGGEPVSRTGFTEYRNPRVARSAYQPRLSHLAVDIETDGLEGALYSIAASAGSDERIFMIAPARETSLPIVWCNDEREALEGFFDWLAAIDPDLLLGWNITNFDLDFLERKCQRLGVAFALARGGERATVLQPQGPRGNRVARVPGRVVLDGIELLRAAFWSFESFELDVVANELLGRGKTIHSAVSRVDEIRRLYREDPLELAAYNLEDCRLVLEIYAKAELLSFAVQRAELTGLAMDRYGGSVAAFDHLYLPRLHRQGRVAPDVGMVGEALSSPGGYVLDSTPGLYDDVLVFDFKSLYPSIIRTFKIDPFGLAEPGDNPVPGFLNASFSRDKAILPEIIASLWQVREQAKQRRDASLSQAVKILMNSFYGVLGSSGCRFFDPRLASSITRRGHEIIRESRAFIEEQGHRVIYGDTDSLFVLPNSVSSEAQADAIGRSVAAELNRWWRSRVRAQYDLESFLEVQYETHFLRFLMPTIRGADTGSKKRYAGLVRAADGSETLVFKGLESVRTDWTPLARRFQRELYRRVFVGEPFKAYVRDTLADLHAGKLDDELVYRKRLRRALDDYTRNVPPHVQAARKLAQPGRWIRYVITRAGPEPVEDTIPAPDYRHYEERQLAPVANAVLHFLGTSFEAITSAQLEIF